MNIETLIKKTNGMNPVQFESFATKWGIAVEWLDVCLTNLNEHVYNAYLNEYDTYVFSMGGAPVEFIQE